MLTDFDKGIRMGKNDFLMELREKLSEALTPSDVNSNVQYYDQYISDAMSNGKTEQEILEQLGEPNLIARTIIENYGTSGQPSDDYVTVDNSTVGDDAENTGSGILHQFNMNSQWGCLVTVLVIVAILGVILWLVGSVLRFLAPVLIPIIVIFMIITFLKNRNS